MTRIRGWIAAALLMVTAVWVTPVFAYDLRETAVSSIVSLWQTPAQAPPLADQPAHAAQLTTYEKMNGDAARTHEAVFRTQVDGLIVGAERAQKSWRHSGVNTL